MYISRALNRYQSFDDFVQYGLLKGYINHIMFVPQTFFIFDWDGTIKVDHLGKFENLSEDFLFVKERLALKGNLMKLNASSKSPQSAQNFSDRTKNILRNVYALDYDLLDYE